MGLGSFILKTAINNATNKFIDETLPFAAGAAALAGVAAVSEVSDRREKKKAAALTANAVGQVAEKKLSENSDYDFNLMCAKIAVCNYIIRADGFVDMQEEEEIGAIIDSVSDMGFSREQQNRIRRIANNPSRSFVPVEQYLKNIKTSDLRVFVILAQEMASADFEISQEELEAISTLKEYISLRQNEDSQKAATAAQVAAPKEPAYDPYKIQSIDLTCPGCCATMDLDKYGYQAECSYCGTKKIINYYRMPGLIKNQEQPKPVSSPEVPMDTSSDAFDKIFASKKIPTFPLIPTAPKPNPRNPHKYQEQMEVYLVNVEKYKREYMDYMRFVQSHPNMR